MTSELIKELAALDKMHQKELVEADAAGEDSEVAAERLRIKYQNLFLEILRRDRTAPVFRIQAPYVHKPSA